MVAFHHRSALPKLIKFHGATHIADIGAGAGESTKLLSLSGKKITAVDRFAPVPPDDWPCCDNRQDGGYWRNLEGQFRVQNPNVSLMKCEATQAARVLGISADPPDAVWFDADLTYSGTLRDLQAWADVLPDGGLLAGAYHVRKFWGDCRGDNSWINVMDAVAAVRRSRACLTDPFTTWQEEWPTWLMFKRASRPVVEIVSAATENVHWWPMVKAHHQRYADHHGHRYFGVTSHALPDRSPVWLKLAVLRERLKRSGAEWLFWLDADAIFWDFERSLSGFVPPAPWEAVFPHFWREKDCTSTGAFLVRNCDQTRALLEETWERGSGGEYGSEESILTDVAAQHACKILLIDHRILNSVPTAGIWSGGQHDFVIHAAFLERHRTGFLRDLIHRAEGSRI